MAGHTCCTLCFFCSKSATNNNVKSFLPCGRTPKSNTPPPPTPPPQISRVQVQRAGLHLEQGHALRLGRHRVPGAVRGGGRGLTGAPPPLHDRGVLRQAAAPPQEREQAPPQTQVSRGLEERDAWDASLTLVSLLWSIHLAESTWRAFRRKGGARGRGREKRPLAGIFG